MLRQDRRRRQREMTIHCVALLTAASLFCTVRGQEDDGGETLEVPQERAESSAEESGTSEESTFDSSDFLLGDWGGVRSDLAERGLTFDIQWTQSVQGVTSGGAGYGFRYGGSLDYRLQVDTQKLGLQPGGFVNFLAESRYGESVNGRSGAILPVNTDLSFPVTDEVDDNIGMTITELSFVQFLSEKFGVAVGKMQTLDGDANEFASGRGRSQFLNASLVFNPVTALMVPYSTLGGTLLFLPTPKLSIASGIYNTEDSSTTTGFGDIGDGFTWVTEAQFQHRLGRLPGGQVAAFIYAGDNEFVNFSRFGFSGGQFLVGRENHTWAAYWSAWQYLFTFEDAPEVINLLDGRPDVRGVGLFARYGFADDDTNPVQWALSGGVGGRGLIPTRDDDTFGVGVAYADFDAGPFFSFLGVDDDAYGFETFYNIALYRGIGLTFDVQVIDPVSSVDTTTILGGRLNIRF